MHGYVAESTAILKKICLQVRGNNETILYQHATPEAYALRVWNTMTSPTSVMTPLTGLLTAAQIRAIKRLMASPATQSWWKKWQMLG